MPWSLILSVVLKLTGWVIDRAKTSKKQKEAFLKFVEVYERYGNASVNQYKDVKKQMDDLNKKD